MKALKLCCSWALAFGATCASAAATNTDGGQVEVATKSNPSRDYGSRDSEVPPNVLDSSIPEQLKETRASIREAGEPDSLQELNAWYPNVPDDENAAMLYADAFEIIDTTDPEGVRIKAMTDFVYGFDFAEEFPRDRQVELQAFVAELAPALDILSKAARLERSRFPQDLRLGYDLEFPHLAKLRNAARALFLASADASLNGENSLAFERHAAIPPVAGALAAEPILIPQLVRIAIHGIALHSLERLLNTTRLDDAQLDLLAVAHAKPTHPDTLRNTLVGERCLVADTVRLWYNGGSRIDGAKLDTDFEKFRTNSPHVDAYANFEQLFVYKVFRPYIPPPVPDWPAQAQIARRELANEHPDILVASRILSPYGYATLAFVRDIGYQRIAQAAIAVERYRIAHNALPGSLADCVATYLESAPQDPFDGKPLRFRGTSLGYVIYSVGEDFDDDGGKPAPLEGRRDKDGDLVLTVLR